MSRFKTPLPSEAQARLLAFTWGSMTKSIPLTVGTMGKKLNTPTAQTCVRNGWFEEAGTGGTWPSGHEYKSYRLSSKGMLALECYFAQQRYEADEKRKEGVPDKG